MSASTLWVGDLDDWMNEQWMWHTFSYGMTVLDAKVIRNKQTGQSSGYGFVTFATSQEAETVVSTWSGHPIPNHPQGRTFKLNWASHGGARMMPGQMEIGGGGGDYAVFVGDLAPEVTDYMLMQAFSQRYPTVKNAKVVMDQTSGTSKGFGFVRFSQEAEQRRAMQEMNGYWLASRQIRCSEATKKGGPQQSPSQTSLGSSGGPSSGFSGPPGGGQSGQPEPEDLENTTLFIGGLDQSVNEPMLMNSFSHFGTVVYVRIPAGKACGFVQFQDRVCAEAALSAMNGYQLGTSRMRVSWGKSGSRQKPQALPPASGANVGGGYYTGQPAVTVPNIADSPEAVATANTEYIAKRELRLCGRYLTKSYFEIHRHFDFELAYGA